MDELTVFGQEAVTGMDCLGSSLFDGIEYSTIRRKEARNRRYLSIFKYDCEEAAGPLKVSEAQ